MAELTDEHQKLVKQGEKCEVILSGLHGWRILVGEKGKDSRLHIICRDVTHASDLYRLIESALAIELHLNNDDYPIQGMKFQPRPDASDLLLRRWEYQDRKVSG